MNSREIRKKFIDYFTKTLRGKGFGHVEIPSSCLVPENHPTLLFVNSGMVQLAPYFLGERDPVKDFGSNRLCNVQKVIRTIDLDIIGVSKYHLSFFEMLGSWSIGDYGKKEAVEFAYDLLVNSKYGYGLDPDKFYPTVFCGDEETACDQETIDAWKAVGIPDKKISRLPASENWWTVGEFHDPGPCGPCTEILYDRGAEFGPEEDTPGLTSNPRYLEIWNAGVFMEYNRDESGKLSKLSQMSVDTGAGFERFAVLLQDVDSVFETDLFKPMIDKTKSFTNVDLKDKRAQKAIRRATDHIKACVFIASEHVYPSNKDQGYVLRRLMRTAFNDFKWGLEIEPERTLEIIPIVVDMYKDRYPEVNVSNHIQEVFTEELKRYMDVIRQSKHVIKRKYQYKHKSVDAFEVYQSTGAPLDLVKEIANEMALPIDETSFDEKLKNHREKSKKGAGAKFKGGLRDHSIETARLHTATHLLQQALRDVLGSSVKQMGSNITSKRLRFDFSYDHKLTEKDLQKIEDIVNEKIMESLPVNHITLPIKDAEKTGALKFFKEKYGHKVTVYYLGENIGSSWSKEFCGGPHVKNTKELGKFKVIEESSVGKGIRRIKAVLD